jgi:E3 ubiquitin-protein ligase UBR7
VELLIRRDFRCDCGTARTGSSVTACTLQKPDEEGREPRAENRYDHNFEGKFCLCSIEYDHEKE